jgi:hypothetical protein
MRDHGLAETQPGYTQLVQLVCAQLRVPFLHELQGLIHPGGLIFRLRPEHSTLADRAEQLVARTVYGTLALNRTGLRTSFPHYIASLVVATGHVSAHGTVPAMIRGTHSCEI